MRLSGNASPHSLRSKFVTIEAPRSYLAGDQVMEVFVVRWAQRFDGEAVNDEQRHAHELLELAPVCPPLSVSRRWRRIELLAEKVIPYIRGLYRLET
jgi:hypothetical protein